MKSLAFPIFLVLLTVSSCSQTENHKRPSPDEIVIGAVDSYTGALGEFGLSVRSGIEMAVSNANAAGGVRGKKIRLAVMDDQGKPEKSKEAFARLVSEEHAAAVLGASASSRSIEMASASQELKVPMITPSSTNPKVTETGDYVFRVCFIDTFQGPVMARFVRTVLKAGTVAFLRDEESPYSEGLARFFRQKFTELGGEIVADLSYRAGDADFKPQLSAIAARKPDVIYVPGYYTDVANIVVQARRLGIKARFTGGDGWDSNELYEIGGASLEASYFTNHYSPNSKEPVHLKFAAEYKTKYETAPNAGAALGYDAAMVLLDAIRRAKSLSGSDLRDAIASTKNFPGVTGVISLDEHRNAVKPAVIFKVQGKKSVYVQTIAP